MFIHSFILLTLLFSTFPLSCKDASERSECDRIEWQLKQQEHEDIQTYREACKASRRESVAIRLQKAKENRTVEEALQQQRAILEKEELRLRAEDHAMKGTYSINTSSICCIQMQALPSPNNTPYRYNTNKPTHTPSIYS